MLGSRGGFGGPGARRAVVKTRLVRLVGKGLAAARAHLRYIQRDGVSRDGERGALYSAAEDEADGRAFLERCDGDRHQFRFIVSAEDAAEYADLRPLVRRLMARMEADLGTRLDWVAADHVDTSHPHTHVMLRGKDELGENLVIAPDYIKRGMRERLAELVTLDLGPRTDREIQRRLILEVGAERLTATDRHLLSGMDMSRTISAAGKNMLDQSIRTGRLRKLESLGFAQAVGGGRWRLHEDLEERLRRLGERGDIIRTMQRAITAAGLDRASSDQIIFQPEAGHSLTGRIVDRGLADELRDRQFLIVDGVDGRSHYVDIGRGGDFGPLAEGAIVRLAPRAPMVRAADRRIADIAARNGGSYRVDLHRAAGASASFAESHVRRLEAIRRTIGGIERGSDGTWSIPPDFLDRARRHELLRARDTPVELELLSPFTLERLIAHEGATWLDLEILSPAQSPRDAGFGREVRSALEARRAWLIDQRLASLSGDQLVCRADLLELLERRELQRVAAAIARSMGRDFIPAQDGARVEGVARRRVDLASGRFMMIDNGREFALVPWRPVLERAIGRQVSGLVASGAGISWSIGRDRGPER